MRTPKVKKKKQTKRVSLEAVLRAIEERIKRRWRTRKRREQKITYTKVDARLQSEKLPKTL